ncbi:hypothetical protein SDC9_70391 [bioreactor metagenome]|uniref:Uncharacterized protein n=1 Tax=bioreactor metagenome TaxID=1076179 RepID=A0A644YCQ3_9ZZZZ
MRWILQSRSLPVAEIPGIGQSIATAGKSEIRGTSGAAVVRVDAKLSHRQRINCHRNGYNIGAA